VKLNPRAKLLLLFAGFALPIVASFVAYFFYHGEATGNYGELLLPPARITSHPFGRMDGAPWSFDDLRGRWVLAVSDAGACPAACVESSRWCARSTSRSGEMPRAWRGYTSWTT
jgi:hypothetical protein